jgi:hypothetical protein
MTTTKNPSALTALRKLLKQHDIKLTTVLRGWETGITKHTTITHKSGVTYGGTFVDIPAWVEVLHQLAYGKDGGLFLRAREELRDFPEQRVLGCLDKLCKVVQQTRRPPMVLSLATISLKECLTHAHAEVFGEATGDVNYLSCEQIENELDEWFEANDITYGCAGTEVLASPLEVLRILRDFCANSVADDVADTIYERITRMMQVAAYPIEQAYVSTGGLRVIVYSSKEN